MASNIYAIGATQLTGGVSGCLDNYSVTPSNTDPAITDGMVAMIFVKNQGFYIYIAIGDSGEVHDGLKIIKPLYLTPGVEYTGDLRWKLHYCDINGGSF